MAISDDPQGERWYNFKQKTGPSIADFCNFIERLLNFIPDGNAQRRRLFTDNLAAHKQITVVQLILSRGHRICFRAPYWAVDGSIEDVFNTIQHDLTIMLGEIKDATDLHRCVNEIIQAIEEFVEYFNNVGS